MFNKDTPIQRKLMAVILLTTSVALILSCIGFISYEIFTLHKNMARALSTRAEIIAANLPDELAARDQKNATEILNALINLAENGGHIVASSSLYGGTYNLLHYTLPKLGVEVSFVGDPDDADARRDLIRP